MLVLSLRQNFREPFWLRRRVPLLFAVPTDKLGDYRPRDGPKNMASSELWPSVGWSKENDKYAPPGFGPRDADLRSNE